MLQWNTYLPYVIESNRLESNVQIWQPFDCTMTPYLLLRYSGRGEDQRGGDEQDLLRARLRGRLGRRGSRRRSGYLSIWGNHLFVPEPSKVTSV